MTAACLFYKWDKVITKIRIKQHRFTVADTYCFCYNEREHMFSEVILCNSN